LSIWASGPELAVTLGGSVRGHSEAVYDLSVDSREVVRRLEADGWIRVGQRGSHLQLKHPSKPGRVTVPHPKKDLPKGTLRSIERQSGVSLT
jgi:predicted RNA binding protein YcfA (HicA-like mRNA interferase family)